MGIEISGVPKFFSRKDLEEIVGQTMGFIERKVQDSNISDIQWRQERNSIKEIFRELYIQVFQKVEECLRIEEAVLCTDEEKREALQQAAEKVAVCEDFFSWFNSGLWEFVEMYSINILKKGEYKFCTYCMKDYTKSLWSDEVALTLGKRQQEQKFQRKLMGEYLDEKDIEKYIKLMMEYGKTVHEIFLDDLEKVVCVLQDSEYKDMDNIWENIIYYILVVKEIIGKSVLQQPYEESKESYTREDIKKVLKDYYEQHKNFGRKMITEEKFYVGLKLCEKFDNRIYIEDSEKDEQESICSFPKKLEKILMEVSFSWSSVEDKNCESKRVSLYKVLNSVLEKLDSLKMSEGVSDRKILADWTNNIEFSYKVLTEGAKSLYLNDFSDRVDLELVEAWNGYTGQLIINCIWTALSNNEVNKFFIWANAPKNVSKEQKEQLDKALYWSVEEVINLTQYFSYTETAFIAEQLYSCVGMLAAKAGGDISIAIEIFNSLAVALQAMKIDKMYEYWKSLADGIQNDNLKASVEEVLNEDTYYWEFFVRYRGRIDEENLKEVRGRYSLLYNRIEKAVLFNLYKKRI